MIQELRAKLIKTAKGKQLTDPEIIKVSQELDKMLVEYENFFKRKIK
jgi:hypothetical protein